MVTKYALYGILIQTMFLSLIIASPGNAQRILSVRDVNVQLQLEDTDLFTVFKRIEKSTDYHFAYNKNDIDRKIKITQNFQGNSLYDVLAYLSQETKLRFKQVNHMIMVQKDAEIRNFKPEIEILLQITTITGRITSGEDNAAIPGANVVIKGTNQGTITDINGNYSIDVTGQETVLVFSSVGFQTEEVVAGNRSVINITLFPDVTALQEVVVTALGIEKETRRLGYAVAAVAPDEVTINRTPNFMNALQGKVAGMNVSSLGSGPAGTSKVRIRGQSSFGGQNNPLIIINGMPIDNTNFGANPRNLGSDNAFSDRGRSRVSDGGDGLTSINPDDIESMTVLKGAAASALYGSRAKDGVIMITTKSRGKEKGLNVTYNSNYTVDTPLDFTDFQMEYGQGENGVRPTTPNPTSGVWSFGERFQPGMTQILFDGIEVPYEPQPSHVKGFYRNGYSWTNTITVASGGDNGGFNLSLANLSNEAIVPNSGYTRRTINLGFTQTIAERLTVSGNANYSNELIKNPPQIAEQDMSTPTTIYSLANSMPLELMQRYMADENGNESVYSRFRNRTNPYWAAYERFDNVSRDRLFGNITARYDFTNWMYIQGRAGMDFFSRSQEYNFPTGSASLPNAPVGFVNGEFVQDVRKFRELNGELIFGVRQSFGDFGIDLTLGGNQMYRRLDRHNVLVNDFVVRDLYTVMNGRVKDPIYELSERQVNSVFGAVEFSWKNFLYLTLTGRNDWFSTLSPGNRSILYPALNASFVISDAFDMPEWVDLYKLRVGFARVGSDTDVAPYSNNLFYRINNNLFPNPAGQMQPVGFITSGTVPNANLRPMTVTEYEIGMEAKLFKNRVGIDLTYYDKLTTDQILSAQISDASGYTNQLINVGESRNYGVEMLVSFVPLQSRNFRWETSFNGAYNRTEVINLGEQDEIIVGRGVFEGELRQVVGMPMGQLYGFGYLRDSQGRQVFDPNNGRPLRTSAQIPFGTAIPIWVGGIFNQFEFKGINLSFLVDFKLGHKMISGTNFNAWRHGLHKETLVGRDQGFVVGQGVNPNGEINTAQSPIQFFYETVRAANLMEPITYDAGFWKLRQITIGYDFTKFLPVHYPIKGLRLNAVANNVGILKKWVPNIDPEQFGFTSDNLVGLETPGLPTTRSIGFNLNVRF
ncbi:MAG: SusC/RagA family TonB-linked outer membrane protein [Cyclobacteriaceae bacterium]|nr:SusC/RagA family TonB-linked outer membrane protein [Cyclobacteriaceae bacterium]